MKNKKRHVAGRVLNAVIVVLALIFAASLAFMIKEIREARTGYTDKEEFLMMDLQDRDYTELYRRSIDNGVGRNVSGGVAEFYAVGRYYRLEFYRNAFEQAGLSGKAEAYADRMEGLEEAMGEFSGEAAQIRGSLP